MQPSAQHFADLAAVLDANETDDRMVSDETDLSLRLLEEHTARVKAEAEAADRGLRLRVAQEQLAEHAAQKAVDAGCLATKAADCLAALEALSKPSGEGSSSGATDISLVSRLAQQLQEMLVEAAHEATAFAAQQRQDADRLKRSHHQADLPSTSSDPDLMKRAREGGPSPGTEEPQEGGSSMLDTTDHDSPNATPEQQLLPSAATAAPAHNDSRALRGHPTGSTSSSHSDSDSGSSDTEEPPAGAADGEGYLSFRQRARYIPIRLSQEERRLLRLLEAALNVSDYTGQVDIQTWKKSSGRMHAQIKDLCSILSGLYVAHDYKKGQALIKDRDFASNAAWFQSIFELGRRYKIMNPDKMRSEYGKLMYLLMDSVNPEIQELLEFACVVPLRTVYSTLEARGGLKLLDDPLLPTATAEIVAAGRPRGLVQSDIRRKERAREALAKRHSSSSRSGGLSEEEVLNCIYSISDNAAYLLFNRDPIDRMIAYFTTAFAPKSFSPGGSLAISSGCEGARLTHNHERQYAYVLQSLTLWREITSEAFKLWLLSEECLLSQSNRYRLCDTGQGLNRVQAAPSVRKALGTILERCQRRIGSWVGSSVVHLGDNNVPNALMFIDKYTQVPRILTPVVLVLEELPALYKKPGLEHLATCIDAMFGGLEQCQRAILTDFCRHAFDGSGADNFFDAGSCIDGRLTSAWNWCSKLEKKPYYIIFKLAGFVGFDGDFKG
ncbi:MAG: hypothetical protein WDW36_008845 [Sanguina aurantia]